MNLVDSVDKFTADALPRGSNPVLSFKGQKTNEIDARGFHEICLVGRDHYMNRNANSTDRYECMSVGLYMTMSSRIHTHAFSSPNTRA